MTVLQMDSVRAGALSLDVRNRKLTYELFPSALGRLKTWNARHPSFITESPGTLSSNAAQARAAYLKTVRPSIAIPEPMQAALAA